MFVVGVVVGIVIFVDQLFPTVEEHVASQACVLPLSKPFYADPIYDDVHLIGWRDGKTLGTKVPSYVPLSRSTNSSHPKQSIHPAAVKTD